MSSPTSSNASLYPPPVRRTVYVVTDTRGWFLSEAEPGQHPTFTPDPIEALRNAMAWLTREVGEARLRLLNGMKLGAHLHLSTVELELRSGGWAAVSSIVSPKP